MGGLVVGAAAVLMFKSGRLKTCKSSRSSSSAAVPASGGNSSAPSERKYPEAYAPAPASGVPGDRNGQGMQYPSATPAVEYPEVAPVVQYPVIGTDSPPPPPPYEGVAGIQHPKPAK